MIPTDVLALDEDEGCKVTAEDEEVEAAWGAGTEVPEDDDPEAVAEDSAEVLAFSLEELAVSFDIFFIRTMKLRLAHWSV